jgi:hypothetical protein
MNGNRHHAVSTAVATTVALVVALVASVVPAAASPIIDARAIDLDVSATCEHGNVDITYDANGVERQIVDFTSQAGTVLDHFETAAYDPNFDGTEYILTKAGSNRAGNQPVPVPGTVLGVYVTLGSNPPSATNGEFFLLYRCDDQRNDRGGANEVLQTCVGDYGTCPKTAVEALAPTTTTTTPTTSPPVPAATPAAAVTAVPTFTG